MEQTPGGEGAGILTQPFGVHRRLTALVPGLQSGLLVNSIHALSTTSDMLVDLVLSPNLVVDAGDPNPSCSQAVSSPPSPRGTMRRLMEAALPLTAVTASGVGAAAVAGET